VNCGRKGEETWSTKDEILHSILEAIMPDQGPDNFDSILAALQDAISFQMAFACPICRKRLASKLRQDIPAMLVRADQLCARPEPEPVEGVASATLWAAEYLVREGDPERMRKWLARHSATERRAILEHLERRRAARRRKAAA
jgi:hypothetical protein